MPVVSDEQVEAARERQAGELLREARERLRPKVSKREAARRAGFSPTQWGDMERGHRQHGAPVRATSETLAAAADAVELDRAVIFEAMGKPYPAADLGPSRTDRLTQLERRVAALEDVVLSDRASERSADLVASLARIARTRPVANDDDPYFEALKAAAHGADAEHQEVEERGSPRSDAPEEQPAP